MDGLFWQITVYQVVWNESWIQIKARTCQLSKLTFFLNFEYAIRGFNVISKTIIEMGWNLTPLQRCSWCILQPQPTGLFSGFTTSTEYFFFRFYIYMLPDLFISFIYIYIYIYIKTHSHTHLYTYIPLFWAYKNNVIYIYTYIYYIWHIKNNCIYIYIYIYVCVCVCVYTVTFIYIYIYI